MYVNAWKFSEPKIGRCPTRSGKNIPLLLYRLKLRRLGGKDKKVKTQAGRKSTKREFAGRWSYIQSVASKFGLIFNSF